MAVASDKSCPSCRSLAKALSEMAKLLPSAPADLIERMAQSEVQAFQQGIEYGRQLERMIGSSAATPAWDRRLPVVPDIEAESDAEDSVRIADSGVVGPRNGT